MRPRSKTKLSAKEPLAESLPASFSRKRAKKRDVARENGVSIRTVDSWMAQKRIPYIKLGHVVRFDLDQVAKALSRYTVREVF